MVGMYIHDLDASWMDHPFFSNSFPVKDARTIGKILNARIRHVYIDTEKGIDLPPEPDSQPESKIEVVEETPPPVIQQVSVLDQVAPIAKSEVVQPTRVRYEQEVYQARKVLRDAQVQVQLFMDGVRKGQTIDLPPLEEVVDSIRASIVRNPDALIYLSRLKQRDQYIYQHSISTCVLMTAFAHSLKMGADAARQFGLGALLQDVGKMRVPLDLLNKPDKLTVAEYRIIKEHVELGGEVIADLGDACHKAINMTLEHHERVDGSGYPFGLVEEEISQEGRMAAIVDVYDALTSDRVYKRAWEPTFTLGKLVEWSGRHFSKNLVHQFVRCVGIYPVGTLVRLDSGMVGVVVDQNESDLLLPIVRVVFDEGRKRYIKPNDVDLVSGISEVQIVGAVAPTEVGVDPQAFV